MEAYLGLKKTNPKFQKIIRCYMRFNFQLLSVILCIMCFLCIFHEELTNPCWNVNPGNRPFHWLGWWLLRFIRVFCFPTRWEGIRRPLPSLCWLVTNLVRSPANTDQHIMKTESQHPPWNWIFPKRPCEYLMCCLFFSTEGVDDWAHSLAVQHSFQVV